MKFNQKEQTGIKLAVDVDETVFDSRRRSYEQLNKIAIQVYGVSPEALPSFANFSRHGHKIYLPIFGKEDLHFLQTEMIFNRKFNTEMRPVSGAREALETLAPHVLLYLTARPSHLEQLTHNEIVTSGFPDRTVIASPGLYNADAEWKIDVLLDLAHYYDVIMLMIDDSELLFNLIQKYNFPQIKARLIKTERTRHNRHAKTWPQIVNEILR